MDKMRRTDASANYVFPRVCTLSFKKLTYCCFKDLLEKDSFQLDSLVVNELIEQTAHAAFLCIRNMFHRACRFSFFGDSRNHE